MAITQPTLLNLSTVVFGTGSYSGGSLVRSGSSLYFYIPAALLAPSVFYDFRLTFQDPADYVSIYLSLADPSDDPLDADQTDIVTVTDIRSPAASWDCIVGPHIEDWDIADPSQTLVVFFVQNTDIASIEVLPGSVSTYDVFAGAQWTPGFVDNAVVDPTYVGGSDASVLQSDDGDGSYVELEDTGTYGNSSHIYWTATGPTIPSDEITQRIDAYGSLKCGTGPGYVQFWTHDAGGPDDLSQDLTNIDGDTDYESNQATIAVGVAAVVDASYRAGNLKFFLNTWNPHSDDYAPRLSYLRLKFTTFLPDSPSGGGGGWGIAVL